MNSFNSSLDGFRIPNRCTILHIDGDTEDLDKYITGKEIPIVLYYVSLTNRSRCVALKSSSLTSLSMARDPRRARFSGGVGDTEVELLVSMLPGSNIEHLCLSFNRIGDSGLKRIASILNKTKLVSLDLETANINAGGAEALAEALSTEDSDLTRINLSNNNIAGAAAALLKAAVTHPKIESIGDEGTTVSLITTSNVSMITYL